MKKLKSKNLKGFTLIEILLATSILVMVGVAAIGVERNFMGSASTNKHKLQATALAQEGISAARAIFNSHILVSANPALPTAPGIYYLGSDNNLHLCSGACHKINADNFQGDITQNNVTFTRTITVPAAP